jgi:hypothetical protein
LRFKRFTSSSVSGSLLARNSRTRRKRGTEEGEELFFSIFYIFFFPGGRGKILFCNLENKNKNKNKNKRAVALV